MVTPSAAPPLQTEQKHSTRRSLSSTCGAPPAHAGDGFTGDTEQNGFHFRGQRIVTAALQVRAASGAHQLLSTASRIPAPSRPRHFPLLSTVGPTAPCNLLAGDGQEYEPRRLELRHSGALWRVLRGYAAHPPWGLPSGRLPARSNVSQSLPEIAAPPWGNPPFLPPFPPLFPSLSPQVGPSTSTSSGMSLLRRAPSPACKWRVSSTRWCGQTCGRSARGPCPLRCARYSCPYVILWFPPREGAIGRSCTAKCVLCCVVLSVVALPVLRLC